MFNFEASKVTKAYNGKTGCMCGCRGNYSKPGTAATTRRVKKVLDFVGPMRPDSNDACSYSTEGFAGERYVAVTYGDRVYVVYYAN